jgi:hypothetical protein
MKVKRIMTWGLAAMIAGGLATVPALAQAALGLQPAGAAVVAPPAPSEQDASEPRAPAGFVRDLGRDYRQFLSAETARWLGVGLAASFAVHAADEVLRDDIRALDGGSIH